MPDVSAAIVVLAGAVLLAASVLPSPVTEASRQRLAGLGFLVVVIGLLAWAVGYALTAARLARGL